MSVQIYELYVYVLIHIIICIIQYMLYIHISMYIYFIVLFLLDKFHFETESQ